MTPSAITAGQIGKIQELLGARLRKSGLPGESVQQVLASQGDAVAEEMLAAIRTRVEAISNMIVRRVRPDRTRTPQEVLDATGRNQYTEKKVVATMPNGEGEETDVFFFKPGPEAYTNGYISDDEVARQFDLRGLKPDPYAQAKVHEDDPAFADERPNSTHWKDKDGKWCYAEFNRWHDERYVHVYRHDYDWVDYWWFAGVRK